jgi:hypothetical protein
VKRTDNRFGKTERLVVVHQVSITDGFNAGFGFALGTFMVTVVVPPLLKK